MYNYKKNSFVWYMILYTIYKFYCHLFYYILFPFKFLSNKINYFLIKRDNFNETYDSGIELLFNNKIFGKNIFRAKATMFNLFICLEFGILNLLLKCFDTSFFKILLNSPVIFILAMVLLIVFYIIINFLITKGGNYLMYFRFFEMDSKKDKNQNYLSSILIIICCLLIFGFSLF